MVSVALTDQESPPSYLGELRGKKKNANLGQIPARDKYCAVVVLQLRIPSFFFFLVISIFLMLLSSRVDVFVCIFQVHSVSIQLMGRIEITVLRAGVTSGQQCLGSDSLGGFWELDLVERGFLWCTLLHSGVLVPGGFGVRGTEGKIQAISWARKQKKPFLGKE